MLYRLALATVCLLSLGAAPVRADGFINPDPGPVTGCFNTDARRASQFDKGHSPSARSLTRADAKLTALAQGAGLVETCLTTPNGQQTYIAYGDILYRYEHLQQSHCMALRLRDNKMLAVGTCFPDRVMRDAGIRTGHMRVHLGPAASQQTFEVVPVAAALLPTGPAAVLQVVGGDRKVPTAPILKHATADPMPGQRAILVFHTSDGVLSIIDTECQVAAPTPRSNLSPGSFLNTCRGSVPTGGGLLLDAETYELLGIQTGWRGDGLMKATRPTALLDALGIGDDALLSKD
ncbi:hypothetical protein [Antarctobacter heliothermus]|uniref:Uncharacterized protein n=1 Tax=Antarctobacter heliothermus TaxID=74033 RepID=A0A239AR66_9RHOB|nr:hypothetical protein [Antarctobacter heliothermus]SNR97433.1 hypothetical protein SAMN04488078_100145 [Antarctobacter heliothermus]